LRAPAISENPNSIIPLLYEAKINRLLDYNRTHGRQHGDSAGLYSSHNKQMKKQFESLKLPNYLSGVLGTANVLGVAALLAPRQTLLKEWAYSGFTFTFLGAAAAHLATKQNKAALVPLISSCTRSFVSDASIRSQIVQGHSDLRAVSQPSCQIF
jgi:DoxX-like family